MANLPDICPMTGCYLLVMIRDDDNDNVRQSLKMMMDMRKLLTMTEMMMLVTTVILP